MDKNQIEIHKKSTRKASNGMKVLIATPLYPPDIGGPATYSSLLVDELPSRGYKVEVISFGEVRHLPKVFRHIVYFFKVLINSFDAHVIYAQDPTSVGFPSMIVSKILRKRFLLKIVGDYAWEQGVQRFDVTDNLDDFSREYENEKYSIFVRILKKAQTFTASQADTVIVPSKYLKKIVSNWGIPEKKIKVIYNGFNFAHKLGSKETIRGMLKFDGKILISVGRLVPWKGFKTLISITPDLVKKFHNFKLMIVGSGPDLEKLLRYVSEKNMHDYVAITGSMSHDILLQYLQTSDAFVLNTAYEGFSHQLLEVLAVGVPVITTDVGGNPEIINHEENGLLVPYNDKKALLTAITRTLDDTEFSNNLVKGGKKTAEKFTEDKMIKELIDVLEK